MYSNVVSELWDELKRYINVQDKEEAADAMINVLINNDEDIDDIRAAFKGDSDVKRALSSYSEEEDDDADDDFSYDEDIEDEDDF